MTLVYAKIINMCGAGAGTGDWGQGVGGQGEVKGGQGGGLKLFKNEICTYIALSRPMGPGPITPDFFLKTAEPTALASTGHSNQTNISAYY